MFGHITVFTSGRSRNLKGSSLRLCVAIAFSAIAYVLRYQRHLGLQRGAEVLADVCRGSKRDVTSE